jgi:hypothetical protein
MRAAIIAALLATLVGGGAAEASRLMTGKQIKDGSLTGADVKNKSLTPDDFTGSVQGPQGPAGPAGAQGAPGLANLVTVQSAATSVPPGGSLFPIVWCPAGTSVIGTGFYNSIAEVDFVKSYGSFVGAAFWNTTGVTATGLHVQAVCASVAMQAAARSATSAVAAKQRFDADTQAARDRH